jgi:phosphoribosylaminoimidazole-succinocarboxamide synthase
MSNTITTTNFSFPNQKSVYRGKEVYNINDDLFSDGGYRAPLLMWFCQGTYKGQILNQIATKFMELTQDIVRIG